jgi:hypothetical protein
MRSTELDFMAETPPELNVRELISDKKSILGGNQKCSQHFSLCGLFRMDIAF